MMHNLIDYLYFYSEDHCVPQHLETPEYRRPAFRLEVDWRGFHSSLTEEQKRRPEDLLNRQFTLNRLEERAVFRSGLSVGLELSRL